MSSEDLHFWDRWSALDDVDPRLRAIADRSLERDYSRDFEENPWSDEERAEHARLLRYLSGVIARIEARQQLLWEVLMDQRKKIDDVRASRWFADLAALYVLIDAARWLYHVL